MSKKKTKGERRRERARENTEKREAKRLVDRPNADDEKNGTHQEQDAVHSGTTEHIIGKQPCRKGEEKTGTTQQQAEKRSKVVRFVITRRDAIVAFLDRHGGSVSSVATAVSALGTIAIVVLTCFYVGYSKKQWETMQRQLGDFEESQSARLVIDFESDPCVDGPQGGVMCNGRFRVTNSGPTVAAIVFQGSGNEFGEGKLNFFLGTTIGPIPETKSSGPWLPVGGKQEIGASVSAPNKEALDHRQTYAAVDLSLAYKDIFGRVNWIFDCYMYTPSGFKECPAVTRIPPPSWSPPGARTQSKQ